MANIRKVLVRERWLLAIMFAALVAAILLMADATQSVAYFGRLHNLLLPINTVLLAVFIALIIYNIGRLVSKVRQTRRLVFQTSDLTVNVYRS